MPAKDDLPRSIMSAKAAVKHAPRLPEISIDKLDPAQHALIEAIRSGPRGKDAEIRGPFAVFLHAPGFGDLAQRLGGHCRLRTSVPPRLSEFAILVTARFWQAQYEWFAHARIAERAGVKPQTIRELRAGRAPKSAAKDERAIYDFISELYHKRRVGDRTYMRVNAILGNTATVELVGILGYYALVSMLLNVFRAPLPPGEKLPFRERS
jgi:4-carboxymuconolactone decarboxylase